MDNNDISLAMVVAMDRNRAIGRNNELPWRLSADLKHFKALTLGHPIIMGRLTYESIGRPLPGRVNVVVSRSCDELAGLHGSQLFTDLHTAVETAKQHAYEQNKDTVMVIGGARIYEQLMDDADVLYITHVDTDVQQADAFFPNIDYSMWEKTSLAKNQADEKNEFATEFARYQRLRPALSV